MNDVNENLIQPTRFKPTQSPDQKTGIPITRTQIIVAVLVLTVTWFLWFIFTAKSVRFDVRPANAAAEVSGGFLFMLGEVYLMREGEYRLRATAPGYHVLNVVVTVAEPRTQIFEFAMVKLPGRITFLSDPPTAAVSLAGDILGTTPFETKVAAGEHTVLMTADRYQDVTLPLAVEGMDVAQELTGVLRPNWADVTIPTQPTGATVTVDDTVFDTPTPGPIQLLAGEHRITVEVDLSVHLKVAHRSGRETGDGITDFISFTVSSVPHLILSPIKEDTGL